MEFIKRLRSSYRTSILALLTTSVILAGCSAQPSITWVTPANEAVLSGTVNLVTSIAGSNIVGVEYVVDGTIIAASTSGTARFDTTDLPNGATVIEARAYDALGQRSDVASRTFTINNVEDASADETPETEASTPQPPSVIFTSWTFYDGSALPVYSVPIYLLSTYAELEDPINISESDFVSGTDFFGEFIDPTGPSLGPQTKWSVVIVASNDDIAYYELYTGDDTLLGVYAPDGEILYCSTVACRGNDLFLDFGPISVAQAESNLEAEPAQATWEAPRETALILPLDGNAASEQVLTVIAVDQDGLRSDPVSKTVSFGADPTVDWVDGYYVSGASGATNFDYTSILAARVNLPEGFVYTWLSNARFIACGTIQFSMDETKFAEGIYDALVEGACAAPSEFPATGIAEIPEEAEALYGVISQLALLTTRLYQADFYVESSQSGSRLEGTFFATVASLLSSSELVFENLGDVRAVNDATSGPFPALFERLVPPALLFVDTAATVTAQGLNPSTTSVLDITFGINVETAAGRSASAPFTGFKFPKTPPALQ